MIARLALLLLAAAVASAQNLRTEEHVPLDNARGARVLQRMQTKAAAKHTKAAKSVNTEREAFKAHRDALKGDALKGDALKAPARRTQEDFDSPWTQVVMKGSLVTRSRPNSDCSGPVTEITVEPAGNCFSATEGVGTYVSESGELTRSAWLFGGEEGTDDCSSEPVAWFMVGRGVKPCQMLAGEYSSTGPLMGGTVLSGQSVAQSANKEKAGFMVKHYKDEACEGDLLA
ncbi:hypothetical protein B484DRAFT_408240 [Ochromonadaceae sp. CCMP2298]|nr:hypothetical protein B484DRAFT_408240 [Ochromonadaceae sp. CCMP2298]